jgi:hypothetical protein
MGAGLPVSPRSSLDEIGGTGQKVRGKEPGFGPKSLFSAALSYLSSHLSTITLFFAGMLFRWFYCMETGNLMRCPGRRTQNGKR